MYYPLDDYSNDGLVDTFAVSVPANSFITFVQFIRLDSTVIAAKENVSLFDDVDAMIEAGLFDGITEEEYPMIVNWDMPEPVNSLDKKITDKITLMPNPNNGYVQISFEQLSNISEIRVVNMVGSVVKTVNISKNTTSLNMNTSDLPSGMYFLQFTDGKTQSYVHKMIKN